MDRFTHALLLKQIHRKKIHSNGNMSTFISFELQFFCRLLAGLIQEAVSRTITTYCYFCVRAFHL